METEFTPAMAVHTGPGFFGLAWQTLEAAPDPAARMRLLVSGGGATSLHSRARWAPPPPQSSGPCWSC